MKSVYKIFSIVSIVAIASFVGLRFHTVDCVVQEDHFRSVLLAPNGIEVSDAVKELLQKSQIVTNYTLDDVIEKTQRSQEEGGWLRPHGKEVWELPLLKTEAHAWYCKQFQNIGFLEEIRPIQKRYTYALVFGATIQGMRSRFAYFLKLLQSGIEVDQIVFLVGKRPRDEKKESIEVLFTPDSNLPFKKGYEPDDKIPATETELALLLIAQTDMPREIYEKIVVVDAPMIQKADGTLVRPNTESTVRAWLDTAPCKGSALCISSQPYVARQYYATARLLPKDWNIHCVGFGIEDDEKANISILLDTLARTLWELKKYQESIKS